MDCTRTWSAHRTHNDVNELNDRDPDGAGIGNPALDLAYDKAGNLRTEQIGTGATTVTYTHDAWNRLVQVMYASDVRGEYNYNGLNWRIIKRADTDLDGNLDQQRIMYYSAGWQLLEDRIDDDSPFTPDPLAADVDRHVQYVWCARYIDDIILHREDKNKDGTYEDTYYHLTDVQFSTVAVIDGAADLVERITYTAYGQARHHYMADVDGDGDVDKPELYGIRGIANGSAHAIGEANYDADMDIDRDGDVTLTDYTIANADGTHPALALGLISKPKVDNQIGWDGYVFNAEIHQYHVRYRWYDPVLGRWLERDQAGYVAGMLLYEYVAANPAGFIDPDGRIGINPGAIGGVLQLWRNRGKICSAIKAIAGDPLTKCVCLVIGTGDIVLSNPLWEGADCACNVVTSLEQWCNGGIFGPSAYSVLTGIDCFSSLIGTGIGAYIGGSTGNPAAAIIAILIGEKFGGAIVDILASAGQNMVINDCNPFPSNQWKGCVDLIKDLAAQGAANGVIPECCD